MTTTPRWEADAQRRRLAGRERTDSSIVAICSSIAAGMPCTAARASRYLPAARVERASCTVRRPSARARCASFSSWAGTRAAVAAFSFDSSCSRSFADVRRASFGLAARQRLAVGRLPRRLLGALTGVERARESQAIVSLVHGIVRLLKGAGRVRECRRGVLFSPGRARRVDGALGAIDLFLGGLRSSLRRKTQCRAGRQRGASARKYSRDGVR